MASSAVVCRVETHSRAHAARTGAREWVAQSWRDAGVQCRLYLSAQSGPWRLSLIRALLLVLVCAQRCGMTAGSGGAPGRGVLPNVLPSTLPVGIPPQRVTMLNRLPEDTAAGEYVVYWMSAAQRAASNPALEFAVSKSNQHRLPLLVLFCLTDNYPEAYERHYAFMLEGLVEVNVALRERGIKFAVVRGVAPDPVLAAARKASCVVTDCAYMRLLRGWRMALANEAQVAVFEVEGEVIVPSKLLMDKRDDFAASFRPRLMSHIKDFLVDVSPQPGELLVPHSLLHRWR